MLLLDFLKENSDKEYDIQYYFEYYCKCCKKTFAEIDEEYSFENISIYNIEELDDYEWILDENIDNITNDSNIITITQFDYNTEYCKKCKSNFF